MGELKHWTESSVDAYLYRLAFDFVRQIEQTMQETGKKQAQLADELGVTEGRVSQVFNNPGNLTLRKMIEYARALGKKVAIVAYDDGDPGNQTGPIAPEIFMACWDAAGKPADFFELRMRRNPTDQTHEMIFRSPVESYDWACEGTEKAYILSASTLQLESEESHGAANTDRFQP
jgi:transcriptional regulator with XRE-family HTH domain